MPGPEARRLATCSANTFSQNRLPFGIQSPMVLVLDAKSLEEGQIIGVLQEGDLIGASLVEHPWVMLPENSFVRHPKMRQGRIKLLRPGWVMSQHPQYGDLLHAVSMDQVRKLFAEEAFAKLPMVKEAAQTNNKPVEGGGEPQGYPGSRAPAEPKATPAPSQPKAPQLPTAASPPAAQPKTATPSQPKAVAPKPSMPAPAPEAASAGRSAASARQGRSEAALVSGVPRRPWSAAPPPEIAVVSAPSSPLVKAASSPTSPSPQSPSPKAAGGESVARGSQTLAKMPKQTRAAPELCQRHLQMCNCEHWKVIHTFVFVRSEASLQSEPLAVLREGSLLCAARPEEPRSLDGKWARLGSQAKVWPEITSEKPDFVALGRQVGMLRNTTNTTFDPIVAFDAISGNWINVPEALRPGHVGVVAKLGIQAAHKKLGQERSELHVGLENLQKQLRGMQDLGLFRTNEAALSAEHHVTQMNSTSSRMDFLERSTPHGPVVERPTNLVKQLKVAVQNHVDSFNAFLKHGLDHSGLAAGLGCEWAARHEGEVLIASVCLDQLQIRCGEGEEFVVIDSRDQKLQRPYQGYFAFVLNYLELVLNYLELVLRYLAFVLNYFELVLNYLELVFRYLAFVLNYFELVLNYLELVFRNLEFVRRYLFCFSGIAEELEAIELEDPQGKSGSTPASHFVAQVTKPVRKPHAEGAESEDATVAAAAEPKAGERELLGGSGWADASLVGGVQTERVQAPVASIGLPHGARHLQRDSQCEDGRSVRAESKKTWPEDRGGLSPEKLVKAKEDRTESGGYFLLRGLERVIRLLIMPRANYPMAINRPSYQNRGKLYTQHAVLMRCMRQDGNPGMENGPGGTWRDLLFQAKSLDVCLTNELVFCF
ncbi:unnamed protein product [Durusdinium trenchii]|uniref:Uncharacterized protein n=1 Tax=Durusdinium trenchii TaxID=1381693 RepID=A0ABP0JLZ6_9DINO